MNTNAKMADAMTDVVMKQAMRDKLAEHEKQQKEADRILGHNQEDPNAKDEDDDEFMDEDEREIMQKMKDARLNEAKTQQVLYEEETQKRKENVWYGEYTEIVELEFLPYVTKAEYSAVHFSHKDFERCKIVDKHLQAIAPEHKECKFLKLDAEKSPFFVNKLAIQMLPTVCLFKNGVLIDKIIGFEDFGGRDDFKTIMMTRRLVKAGVLKAKNKAEKGTNIKIGKDKDESDSGDDF